ncbi:hypothetical protein, partial [Holospora undulata]
MKQKILLTFFLLFSQTYSLYSNPVGQLTSSEQSFFVEDFLQKNPEASILSCAKKYLEIHGKKNVGEVFSILLSKKSVKPQEIEEIFADKEVSDALSNQWGGVFQQCVTNNEEDNFYKLLGNSRVLEKLNSMDLECVLKRCIYENNTNFFDKLLENATVVEKLSSRSVGVVLEYCVYGCGCISSLDFLDKILEKATDATVVEHLDSVGLKLVLSHYISRNKKDCLDKVLENASVLEKLDSRDLGSVLIECICKKDTDSFDKILENATVVEHLDSEDLKLVLDQYTSRNKTDFFDKLFQNNETLKKLIKTCIEQEDVNVFCKRRVLSFFTDQNKIKLFSVLSENDAFFEILS